MGLFVNQHVNHKEYIERKAENGGTACGFNNYINTSCCNNNFNFVSIFATALPTLFTMGMQALDKDNSTDISTTTSVLSSFNSAKSTFDSAPTKENAKKLKQIYEQNKDNRTISAGYKALEIKINAALNS